MEEAALQGARFLQYVAVTVLFGTSLFPIYGLGPGRNTLPAPRLLGSLPWAVLGFLTACLSLAFTAANMAGSFSAIGERDTWRAVVLETDFGKIAIGRITLAAVIAGICLATTRRARSATSVAFLSGVLLATLSLVGHTEMEDGAARYLHIGMDALHLLAAGAWLGGLVALLALFQEPYSSRASTILRRFSGMGYLAVAVLLGTGLVNSWFLVNTVNGLLSSTYGHLLMVKLVAFLGMASLAAANRFWLVPAVDARPDSGLVLSRLRQHIFGELGLGAGVLLVVSVLGTVEPAAR